MLNGVIMIFNIEDNFLPQPINNFLYDSLCSLKFRPGTSTFESDNEIPHYVIIDNFESDIKTPIDGYILSTSHIIKCFIDQKYNIQTHPSIYRCHIVEHLFSPTCYGVAHKDVNIIGGEFITCLLYISDYWDSSWGGHTIVKDSRVNFAPNRLVAFNSRTSHYGEKINMETSSRRFAMNVVLKICDGYNPFSP